MVFLYQIWYIIPGRPLLPTSGKILKEMGENIKLAQAPQAVGKPGGWACRHRRSTLRFIEKGEAGVSMSSYLQVLFVLGMEMDLMKVAANDPLGGKLRDEELVNKEK